MSWTKEQERLQRWAEEKQQSLRDTEEVQTYWKEKRMEIGIEEYGFETYKEIQQFLEQYIEDKDVVRIIGVEAIKNKERTEKEREKIGLDDNANYGGDLPDFVYIF